MKLKFAEFRFPWSLFQPVVSCRDCECPSTIDRSFDVIDGGSRRKLLKPRHVVPRRTYNYKWCKNITETASLNPMPRTALGRGG